MDGLVDRARPFSMDHNGVLISAARGRPRPEMTDSFDSLTTRIPILLQICNQITTSVVLHQDVYT